MSQRRSLSKGALAVLVATAVWTPCLAGKPGGARHPVPRDMAAAHHHKAARAHQHQNGLPVREFRRLLLGKFPLSPHEIEQAKRRYRESQLAASRPVRAVHTMSVVLSYQPGPGAPPLRIPVARGYVTSITFVDQRGQAWPVTATYAPKTGLEIRQFPTAPNTVMLTVAGVNPYPRRVGWDAVLAGVDIPISFVAVSGQPVVDSLAVVRVAGLSPPDQKALATSAGATTLSNRSFVLHTTPLMQALAGLPPGPHARRITVPPGAQAWRLGHTIYLRLSGHAALLSPAWSSRAMAHGDTVYDFSAIHSILIMTAQGQMRSWPLHLHERGFGHSGGHLQLVKKQGGKRGR